MARPLFPGSVRKHIRGEKARIRREVLDLKERQEQIEKLLARFLPKQEEEAKAKPKKVAAKKPELATAVKEK